VHLYKKISARRYIALTQSDCSVEHYIALLKFSSVFQKWLGTNKFVCTKSDIGNKFS